MIYAHPDTYEPIAHLDDCHGLLTDFYANQNLQPKRKEKQEEDGGPEVDSDTGPDLEDNGKPGKPPPSPQRERNHQSGSSGLYSKAASKLASALQPSPSRRAPQRRCKVCLRGPHVMLYAYIEINSIVVRH